MTERDDQSIDHELAGVAMAATYEHEQTVLAAETEAALDAVRSRIAGGDLGGAPPSIPLTASSGSRRSPWVRFGAVAAVMAMFALGLVAVVGGRTPDDTAGPATAPVAAGDAGAPAVTDVTTTTQDPVPATTAAPTTTTTIDAEAQPVEQQVIAVDALDPPPLVEPVPYVTLPLEPGTDVERLEFAVGPDHIVVDGLVDGAVTIIARTETGTSSRTVALDEDLFGIVSGPGPVLYGFGDPVVDEANPDVPVAQRFVAIAYLGENEGEVVAVRETELNDYLEIPDYFFGHGPDGVVARGADGETVIGYVDESGEPIDSGEATDNGTPFPTFDFKTGTALPAPPERNTVTVRGADAGWQLEIARDADWGGFPFVGRSVVAPGLNRAIYAERIGADTALDQDFAPNALSVVALLNYDGSGEWIRLPDDWDVVASDVWGTLLARITDDSVEIASLDDLVPPTGPSAPRPVTTDTVEPPTDTTVPIPDSAAADTTTTTTTVQATTTTTTVADTASGVVQPTAVQRNCLSDFECTSLAVSESGRLVTLDPEGASLTVHDADGTEVQSVVQLTDPLADRRPLLIHVGPDDVAYVIAEDPLASDPVGILFAIPLVGSNAGTAVMQWDGVSLVGDSSLIARKTGLTVVPCCGFDTTRPSPDADIYRWVDRNGTVVESTEPSFDLTLGGESGNSLTRIDTLEDGTAAFTRFTLPTAFRSPRDFPVVVATDDGGALAYDFVPTQTGGYEVFVRFDEEWSQTGVDNGQVYYRALADITGGYTLEQRGTVLVAVDGTFVRQRLDDLGDAGWSGDSVTDLDRDNALELRGFNDVVDAEQPIWASVPDLLALQVVPELSANEQIVIEFDAESDAPVITITVSGALDDSVAAVQRIVATERADDGLLRFVSGNVLYRCQPGRGQQDVAPDLCT